MPPTPIRSTGPEQIVTQQAKNTGRDEGSLAKEERGETASQEKAPAGERDNRQTLVNKFNGQQSKQSRNVVKGLGAIFPTCPPTRRG